MALSHQMLFFLNFLVSTSRIPSAIFSDYIFLPFCCLFIVLLNLVCLRLYGQHMIFQTRYVSSSTRLNMLTKNNTDKGIPSFEIISIYYLFTILCMINQTTILHTLQLDEALLASKLFIALTRCCMTYASCRLAETAIEVISNFLTFNFETQAFWIFALMILRSSDISPNPGPAHEFSTGFFSFCNWNLNSLSKDNFSRITFRAQLFWKPTTFCTIMTL